MAGCRLALDRTCQIDGTAIQQELLRQRSLAGVRVGNDCKRSSLLYLLSQIAQSSSPVFMINITIYLTNPGNSCQFYTYCQNLPGWI